MDWLQNVLPGYFFGISPSKSFSNLFNTITFSDRSPFNLFLISEGYVGGYPY